MSRIAYLYSEIMPYTEAVIKVLFDTHDDDILVVSWDKNNLTAHVPSFPAGVTYYKRSKLSTSDIESKIKEFSPDIIYVSGRMDKDYLVALKSAPPNCKIVMGMDTQWSGSVKQIIQILFRYFMYGRYFSHAWVPGHRQYIFARLLGFSANNILQQLYSGNVDLFSTVKVEDKGIRRIVFLGRLELVKGLDILLDAWSELDDSLKTGWELTLIGDGSLRGKAQDVDGVNVLGFLKQEQILDIISCDCVFCLPSRKEPWGVVVHEMAAAGIPLLLSKQVGAGDSFLINGYNGLLLNDLNKKRLGECLSALMTMPSSTRFMYGRRSRDLALSITPQKSAAIFKSILK